MDIYKDINRFPTLAAHPALQIAPDDIRALFDLQAHQWEWFCREWLVPMAEGNARSMNKALELLVRGNLGGYTLRMENEKVKSVANVLADHMIAYFDLSIKRTEGYVSGIAQVYQELIVSMLDKHAIVKNGISSRAGELDLFTYKPVHQIATPE